MKKNGLRKKKIIVSIIVLVAMSFSLYACKNSGKIDSSKTTVINMVVGDNAYGTSFLEDKAKRFSELNSEKSYADGKKGVAINVETSGSAINIDESLLSEDYQIIYTGDGYTKVATAASNGWIASLDEIVKTTIPSDGKTIESKIPEGIRYNFYLDSVSGSNISSGYYGVPGYESYGGLTYDKDLFDEGGYYFAKDGAIDFVTYESEVLGEGYKFNFTSDLDSRSVGPDGKIGTEDDGLPSSLYELIVLCEKLKNDSIPPFIMSGKMGFYINYFTEALYVSLLGYENGKALKDFKSEGVDIVVGYTNEKMFPGEKGLDDVYKPITQRVVIDEQYGYYMSNTVEKYYTFAFMQLMEKNDWYASASNAPNKGASDTQLDFLFGLFQSSRQGAMLIENSYWVNESRIRGNFKDYEVMYGKIRPNREYRWMSLPVNIIASVDGSESVVDTGINSESKKGENITLYIPDGGYLCVNARCKDDNEIMSAIKDWLLFIFSDDELSSLLANGNYGYLLNYEMKESDLENATSYSKSFAKIIANANKVYPYGTSTVYKNNYSKLGKQGGSASYLFGGGSLGTINVREYLRSKEGKVSSPVVSCFEEKMLSITDWNGYFGSNAQVPEAQKYPEGHPKAGQNIKYEGNDY